MEKEKGTKGNGKKVKRERRRVGRRKAKNERNEFVKSRKVSLMKKKIKIPNLVRRNKTKLKKAKINK